MNKLAKVEKLAVAFKLQGRFIKILEQVSFSLSQGETLALLGESGSGKTITALSMMRLLPLTASYSQTSQIKVQEEDLLNLPEFLMRQRRGRRIAMIFQEPMTALNPVLSIGEQLAEALPKGEMTRRQKKLRSIELLNEVEINNASLRLHQYPHQLSGGQKQRVVIAMAIAKRPEILIADEPTTALDVTIQAQILLLLKKLQRQHKMSILFITHDLGVVKAIADRVCVMYGGQIVEEALASDFFAKPKHPYSQQLIASAPELNRRHQLTSQLKRSTPQLDARKILLRVNNLSVHFQANKRLGKKREIIKAVDGLSFTLSQGETLALIGESGCGKTTASHALLRLCSISAGEIFYKDKNILDFRGKALRAYRKAAQIVFQDPFSSMNPRLTVTEILAEGMRAQGWNSARIQKRQKELLDQMNLPNASLSRYPHQFSGGQRQRISIARAIAAHPEILICDEPTSALDLSAQAQILNLLQELQEETGIAYLFITHNMGVVSYMADRVVIMREGKAVEEGSCEDILGRPKHPYTRELLASVLSASGDDAQ